MASQIGNTSISQEPFKPSTEVNSNPGHVNSMKEVFEHGTANFTVGLHPPEPGFQQHITNGLPHPTAPAQSDLSKPTNQQPISQGTAFQQTNYVGNHSPTQAPYQSSNAQSGSQLRHNNANQGTHNWSGNVGQGSNNPFDTTYNVAYNSQTSHVQPQYTPNVQAPPTNHHEHSTNRHLTERYSLTPSTMTAQNYSGTSRATFLTCSPQGNSMYQPNEQNRQRTSANVSETGSYVSRTHASNMVTPEYTRISDDLADKLTKYSHNTIVPFFYHSNKNGNSGNTGNSYGTGHGHSGNSSYSYGTGYGNSGDGGNVRLPNSPMNKKYGSHVGNWDVIVKELSKLREACYRKSVSGNFGRIMQTIVTKYCSDANQKSNFGMLGRGELNNALVNTIPLIVDMALMLPQLVASPISNLKAGESKTIYLTRTLCCSLLANAFFCTFPESSGSRHSNFPDFNFFRLFNDTNSDRCEVKKEKIKCILEYFMQFYSLEEKLKHQIVSFERRCVQQKTNWAQSNKDLCNVRVDSQHRIEQADGMLQCDFANKFIGGGVINDGSVMEEIRFCISPELIVSRLFTEVMNDNEVVVITGSMICSDYTGYSTSFKYTGRFTGSQSFEIDNLGRTKTQLVAIDALSFKKHDSNKQYQQSNVDRELHKCYVAFIHGKNHVTGVATGNWGCGAFNGDPELKFLIQWMAASQQDRGLLQYHVSGDQKFIQNIDDLRKFLGSKKVDVGQVYKTVVKFNGHGSIFKYVKDNLKGGGLMSGFFNSR